VSVLGLFFFIYAVIGMNLWGAVKQGQYLNRYANFQHVGMALLTLFRMITGRWQPRPQKADPTKLVSHLQHEAYRSCHDNALESPGPCQHPVVQP
jgi:hypothetical protein